MKLGIIGAGNIAAKMANTIHRIQAAGLADIELYAIASRSIEKAEQFARKNSVQKAFGSYEDMLQDPAVDLVYVATPHSHHPEHGKMCVLHGKAALIEKPIAPNAAMAKDLFSLAEEKGVLVSEAIWTRYQPMGKMIREFIDSGIVGEPVTITANISHVISQNERIVNPALAGGALLDVGIYTLTFAEMIFGRPDTIQGFCIKNKYGVDAQNSITLTWKDGRMAVLNSGTQARSDQRGEIYCTRGYIMVENITNPQSMTAFDMKREPIKSVVCPTQQTGYEYEVLEMLQALKEGVLECPSMPHKETIHILEEMDELRKNWDIIYPFEKVNTDTSSMD